jgi:hypothetical protein
MCEKTGAADFGRADSKHKTRNYRRSGTTLGRAKSVKGSHDSLRTSNFRVPDIDKHLTSDREPSVPDAIYIVYLYYVDYMVSAASGP